MKFHCSSTRKWNLDIFLRKKKGPGQNHSKKKLNGKDMSSKIKKWSLIKKYYCERLNQ